MIKRNKSLLKEAKEGLGKGCISKSSVVVAFKFAFDKLNMDQYSYDAIFAENEPAYTYFQIRKDEMGYYSPTAQYFDPKRGKNKRYLHEYVFDFSHFDTIDWSKWPDIK